MEVLANGDRRRTVQEPSGAKTVSVVRTDGVTELTAPDGTKTAVEYAPDPRWGAAVRVVADKTVTTPSGKTTRTKRTDTVSAARPARSVLDQPLRTTFDIDGETSSWTYRRTGQGDQRHAAQRRGPRDRRDASTASAACSSRRSAPASRAIEYSYDELGRPKSMKQGAESTTFAYDAKDRLAEQHGRRRQRDHLRLRRRRPRDREAPAGQPHLQVRLRRRRQRRDDDEPARQGAPFSSTGDDRPKAYTPPGASAYDRAYSTERTLESTKLPSGAGRPWATTPPAG